MISKETENDTGGRIETALPEENILKGLENERFYATETKKQGVIKPKYGLLTDKTGNQDAWGVNGAAMAESADQNVTEVYGEAVPSSDTNGAILAETKNSEAEEKHDGVIEMEQLIADKNETSTSRDCGGYKAKDNKLPVDRGWAWMILLGATIEMVIVVGMLKSSGIFFVAFQERFRSSSSMTSLISTVENGVWSVGALLVMTVGMKFFSGRTIHMIGGTALCLSYVISSRAEDVRVLLLSHGVIQGIGMACMEPVSLIMLGTYFEKRRGLANSIANSGGSFGGLVFAPLLTAMFEYYGYSGSMLLCGAFFLHGFISGALFRSPVFYTRTPKLVKDRTNKQRSEIEDLKNGSPSDAENFSSSKPNHFVRQPSEIKDSSAGAVCMDRHKLRARVGSENQIEALLNSHESVLTKKSKIARVRTYTDTEVGKTMDPVARLKTTKYKSAEYIVGSQFDIPSVVKVENDVYVKSKEEKSNGRTCTSCLHGFAKLFDFSLFRNPVFIVFLIAAGILCTPHALCMVYIAPHAKDMGVDSAGVATLLTVYSAIDMCSRIIIGLISDKKWIRRSTMIGITSCTVGILSHLMIFYTNFKWFMFYCVVFGLIGGTYFTLFAVVILDYFSLEKLQSCLGFTILLQALIVSSTFAVLGYLRDNTGSYIVPFHLLGALSLVGGSLMAMLPIVENCYHRDKQPKEQ